MKVIQMPHVRSKYVSTVGELINELEKYNRAAYVMLDNHGDTHAIRKPEIWNDADPDSPIAIYIGDELDKKYEAIEVFIDDLEEPE